MNILNKILYFILIAAAVLLPPSCSKGGGASSRSGEGKEIELKYADNLRIADFGNYTLVTVRNPWDTTRLMGRYALVENGLPDPGLEPDIRIIGVPLKRTVVYSAIHDDLIAELGHRHTITGVCDIPFIQDSILKRRVREGLVTDCGSPMMPSLENILRCNPDAVLLSPYQNANPHEQLDRLGISVIECADYMEASPLGRAEWVKFYGRLFGEAELADSIFRDTENQYLALRAKAASARTRPVVLFDRIYGNAWDIPGKYSTTGRLIEDAGGKNPFDFNEKAGSIPAAPENVLYTAKDADFWFIRNFGENISYKSLASDNALYPQFDAFKKHRIYFSDTSKSRLFEDMAFHPHLILADMISILHPELGIISPVKYYTGL